MNVVTMADKCPEDERRAGKDRRSGVERRTRDDGPPEKVERRKASDRRTGKDRRSDR